MSYELKFLPSALKEFEKLDPDLQLQFLDKLEERCHNPVVQSARLSGFPQNNCFKIKLRTAGYRLVYQVNNGELVVLVVAVGKRDRNRVYNEAKKRL